jgi:protein tyrosine/serine phosphatase
MCERRNLAAIHEMKGSKVTVPNARDLSGAYHLIKPGKVYRSSNPAHAGEERELFPGVACLIDLRSQEEMEDDPPSSLFDQCTLRTYARTRMSFLGRREAAVVVSRPPKHINSSDMVRHNISLLDKKRFYVALLQAIPFLSTLWAIVTFFLQGGASARRILVKHVNQGGLGLLYLLLLKTAGPEINQALTVILESLEAQRTVLVYCKAGKDRTGLICALLLSAIGADEESILNDYCLSNSADLKIVAMAGIEKKRELDGIDKSVFEGAPRAAMEKALGFIKSRFGSVTGYLCSIGFGAEKQWRLRLALST